MKVLALYLDKPIQFPGAKFHMEKTLLGGETAKHPSFSAKVVKDGFLVFCSTQKNPCFVPFTTAISAVVQVDEK